MPRLGRLWRSGGRRAQVAEVVSPAPDASGTEAAGHADIGERLEEARRRLRQTIPPPKDGDPDERRE